MTRWASRIVLLLAWQAFCGRALAQPASDPAAAPDVGEVGPPASVDENARPPSEPAPSELTKEEAEPETLSRTELDALGLDLPESGVDTSFHFSGFADFSVLKGIKPRGPAAIGIREDATFYIGNVNLYLSKNLSESFRMMGEVRLTYLPNGSIATTGTGLEYESTEAVDYANSSTATNWGGIILQRVYLEWTLHHLLALRMGQFLTPYGIWNVDHGSPGYIPVKRPYAINNSFFPERQTGFELFGRWEASNRSTLGYHLTFSNGTGPVSEYKDLDSNKAIGARGYWEFFGASYFRVGFSGYYGRDTRSTLSANLMNNELTIGDSVLSQYDVLALAADYQFKFKQLLLQGEWVSQQRRYTKEGRLIHPVVLAPVSEAASADSFTWAGYQLLAYRFPWYGLTPYVMAEYDRHIVTTPLPDVKATAWVAHVGFNIWPADSVVFKLEYAHINFIDGGALFKYPINTVQFQAAWAF